MDITFYTEMNHVSSNLELTRSSFTDELILTGKVWNTYDDRFNHTACTCNVLNGTPTKEIEEHAIELGLSKNEVCGNVYMMENLQNEYADPPIVVRIYLPENKYVSFGSTCDRAIAKNKQLLVSFEIFNKAIEDMDTKVKVLEDIDTSSASEYLVTGFSLDISAKTIE